MGSSTSSVSTPTFSGSSTYSSAFQTVLTRAVQLASLPMQQMQNHVNDLTSQQSALTQLGASFQSLDNALQSIASASGTKLSANVADPTTISATASSAALAGTYSVQVDTLGSFTTALSDAATPPITDPTTQGLSTSTSLTLTINGVDTTITPADNSLTSLVSAINSSSAGAQATIVNLGTSSSADYRLVVTGNSLSNDTITLADDNSSNLLGTITPGAPATYRVNGSGEISTGSRQVTLSPGLNVTLLNTTSVPNTITVAPDSTALQNALANFATAYNSTVTAVNQQVGQTGGALSGQSIIQVLTGVLRSLQQYSSGSGAVSSLNDLGLTVDKTGQMSFNAGTFNSQSASDIAQFLGNVTSSGFLQAASSSLTAVDDTASGQIEGEFAALQNQINQQNQSIQDEQTRITDMQNNLQSVLTQADAAIATLEGQKTYYTDLFLAQYNSNGLGG